MAKAVRRSAHTGRVISLRHGSEVEVPFGRSTARGLVIESRNGRIEVEIPIAESEPVRTTYAPEEVVSFSTARRA